MPGPFIKASCGCVALSTKIGEQHLVIEQCDRGSHDDCNDIAWFKRDISDKTFEPLGEEETQALLEKLGQLLYDGHKFRQLQRLLIDGSARYSDGT
jgi:hypothetical protein